jgi:hypothetical protein
MMEGRHYTWDVQKHLLLEMIFKKQFEKSGDFCKYIKETLSQELSIVEKKTLEQE